MANKTDMDAIALLKADHRKVEGLFEKYESTTSANRKKALAGQICLELTVHTKIEEDIFYPACKGEIDDGLWHEAYVEHDGAKVMIAEIEAGNPGDEFYDAKVKVLSEMIKHHVKEEERRAEGMFAQARDAGLDTQSAGRAHGWREKGPCGEVQSHRPSKAPDNVVHGDQARLTWPREPKHRPYIEQVTTPTGGTHALHFALGHRHPDPDHHHLVALDRPRLTVPEKQRYFHD